jgi:hypothetical protein
MNRQAWATLKDHPVAQPAEDETVGVRLLVQHLTKSSGRVW